jgi:hypothetical protein
MYHGFQDGDCARFAPTDAGDLKCDPYDGIGGRTSFMSLSYEHNEL